MFPIFKHSRYYSSVVLTTVGFGDISPESPIGRFVSMITALLGIVVASLLVALLTTKYGTPPPA